MFLQDHVWVPLELAQISELWNMTYLFCVSPAIFAIILMILYPVPWHSPTFRSKPDIYVLSHLRMVMLALQHQDTYLLGSDPALVGKSSILVYKIVFYSVLGFYIIFTVVTFSLYIWRARRSQERSLRERSVFLLTLQVVGGFIFGCCTLCHNAIPLFPCFLDFWLLYTGYNIWLYAFGLRALRFYIQARSHTAIGHEVRDNPIRPGNLHQYLDRLREIGGQRYLQSSYNLNKSQPTISPTDGQRKHSLAMSLQSVHNLHRHRPSVPDTVDTNNSTSLAAIVIEPAEIEQRSSSHGSHSGRVSISSRLCCNSKELSLRQKNANRSRVLTVLARGIMSNRVVGKILLILLVLLAIGLLFGNIFSPLLTIRPMHYNCVRAWVMLPLAIFSGIYYFIACPILLALIWRYHDAYGIRNSLIICVVTGMLQYPIVIVWEFAIQPINHYITPLFFTWAQMFIIYIQSIVVPLVESFYIAYRERRRSSMNDADQFIDEFRRPSRLPITARRQSGTTREGFYAALQDPEEHERLKQFAVRCFCSELMSFLDAYAALKANIHLDLKTHSTPEQNTNLRPISGSVISSFDTLQPPTTTPNLHVTCSISGTGRSHASQDVVAPFLFDDTRRSESPESRLTRPSSFGIGLTDITTGIVQTMAKAFPRLVIDDSTTISERIREPVSAILTTFILPESSLAINTSSQVIRVAQDYLDGAQSR
ncbi:hypothetical protein DL89DRAFT_256664 [Linderina pennispora]|uniref:RGS domain-containing protein n=1 Tax=Linderina pennispora TaxID=61395 RepID=A0A1Y1WA74_9FUNG|nr:uncharacterized protein DL89DRAFT_256664 [Linderina pennispora]ORX70447.1 hypothetical protein DL89DRAFT_256664 [Linderina pennispora]